MRWFFEGFFPVVWVAFILYWRIKASGAKTTQRLEPAASRILRTVITLIVIVLFSLNRIPLRWLYLPLWPAGISTGLLGAAIALSRVRGMIGFVLFVATWLKLRMEEAWMLAQFGETYAAYSQRTAALVPFLF